MYKRGSIFNRMFKSSVNNKLKKKDCKKELTFVNNLTYTSFKISHQKDRVKLMIEEVRDDQNVL